MDSRRLIYLHTYCCFFLVFCDHPEDGRINLLRKVRNRYQFTQSHIPEPSKFQFHEDSIYCLLAYEDVYFVMFILYEHLRTTTVRTEASTTVHGTKSQKTYARRLRILADEPFIVATRLCCSVEIFLSLGGS